MSELIRKALADEVTYSFRCGEDKELMATEADKGAHNQKSNPCKSSATTHCLRK